MQQLHELIRKLGRLLDRTSFLRRISWLAGVILGGRLVLGADRASLG